MNAISLLRVSALTYLCGWLYERVVNAATWLAPVRCVLVFELERPLCAATTTTVADTELDTILAPFPTPDRGTVERPKRLQPSP